MLISCGRIILASYGCEVLNWILIAVPFMELQDVWWISHEINGNLYLTICSLFHLEKYRLNGNAWQGRESVKGQVWQRCYRGGRVYWNCPNWRYVIFERSLTHLVSDNSMTMILSLHGTEHQTMLSVNDRIQYYVKVACYEMRSFLDVGHSRYIILWLLESREWK